MERQWGRSNHTDLWPSHFHLSYECHHCELMDTHTHTHTHSHRACLGVSGLGRYGGLHVWREGSLWLVWQRTLSSYSQSPWWPGLGGWIHCCNSPQLLTCELWSTVCVCVWGGGGGVGGSGVMRVLVKRSVSDQPGTTKQALPNKERYLVQQNMNILPTLALTTLWPFLHCEDSCTMKGQEVKVQMLSEQLEKS